MNLGSKLLDSNTATAPLRQAQYKLIRGGPLTACLCTSPSRRSHVRIAVQGQTAPQNLSRIAHIDSAWPGGSSIRKKLSSRRQSPRFI